MEQFNQKLRFEIYKEICANNDAFPEKIKTKKIREMFDHDLTFLKLCVTQWNDENKKKQVMQNIDLFLESEKIDSILSFSDHCAIFSKISMLMSGINVKDIDKKYNEQIKTIVPHVIHPLGTWTLRNEIENQYYSKYVMFISKNGLSSIKMINDMTSTKIGDKYISFRFIGIPCNEVVGYDGVENTGCYMFMRHDFIHSGFLRYHYDRDKDSFDNHLRQIGEIRETYMKDESLTQIQQNCIEVCYFMWTHELTTSVFVDGFPRKIPNKSFIFGTYGSVPQKLLRFASKIGYIPDTFKNEIQNEYDLLKYMKLLPDNNDKELTEHAKMKIVMETLDYGYKYLYDNFHDSYERKYGGHVIYTRITTKLKNFLSIFY